MEPRAEDPARAEDLTSSQQCGNELDKRISDRQKQIDLDERISDRQKQIELCTMVLKDLLHIQKIVEERGLEHVSFHGADN